MSSGQEFTDYVISSMGPKATPRARFVIGRMIQHIHDFAREINLTTEEWLYGIDILNQIGQMSDIRRNEGILVSDVLGLESLVDEITHSVDNVVKTSTAIIGPFYRENSPVYQNGESIIQKEVGGIKSFVHGKVTDSEGNPLANAKIEVWHCAPNGLYEQQDDEQPDYNLRGTFFSDDNGEYSYICLKPTSYPIPYDGPAGLLLQFMDRHPNRPSHIHWRVSTPSFVSLITQIYSDDDPYVEDDSVFAVKEDCIVSFKPIEHTIFKNDAGLKAKNIKNVLNYDIKLCKESAMEQAKLKIKEEQLRLEREHFAKYTNIPKPEKKIHRKHDIEHIEVASKQIV